MDRALWADENTSTGGHGDVERKRMERGENRSDGGNTHRSIIAVSQS